MTTRNHSRRVTTALSTSTASAPDPSSTSIASQSGSENHARWPVHRSATATRKGSATASVGRRYGSADLRWTTRSAAAMSTTHTTVATGPATWSNRSEPTTPPYS
ncbi:hypothetical protein [Nonomuraea recticatena]|uniref:hypothetical protein n=1 Tax=Nonomuraea recticatena TaxID=46178 RepID=UPI00360C0317